VFVKLQACAEGLHWYLVASLPVYAIVAVAGLVDWFVLTRLEVHNRQRPLKRKLQTNFCLLFSAAVSRCAYLLVAVLWGQPHPAAFFVMFCLSQLCMFWLFSAVILVWCHIHQNPMKDADEKKQFRILVVVNTLLVAVVLALVVLVSTASGEADKELYVWVANTAMGVFSLVLGLLLSFYGHTVGALANKTRFMKSPGKTKGFVQSKDYTQYRSYLLGFLFCAQAACWWAVRDPHSPNLPVVVVVSHSLSGSSLVLLLLIYHKSATKLRRMACGATRFSGIPMGTKGKGGHVPSFKARSRMSTGKPKLTVPSLKYGTAGLRSSG
jgi:hypothetical protein